MGIALGRDFAGELDGDAVGIETDCADKFGSAVE
jgi:hypothetical protein